jgi:hypothetical protein
MIPLNDLLITRRRRSILRGLSLCSRWHSRRRRSSSGGMLRRVRLDITLLLRELRIRDSPITPLRRCGSGFDRRLSSSSGLLVLRLLLVRDVVICDLAALGVVLREFFVRRLGRGGDDVPGVEEAGEEA